MPIEFLTAIGDLLAVFVLLSGIWVLVGGLDK